MLLLYASVWIHKHQSTCSLFHENPFRNCRSRKMLMGPYVILLWKTSSTSQYNRYNRSIELKDTVHVQLPSCFLVSSLPALLFRPFFVYLLLSPAFFVRCFIDDVDVRLCISLRKSCVFIAACDDSYWYNAARVHAADLASWTLTSGGPENSKRSRSGRRIPQYVYGRTIWKDIRILFVTTCVQYSLYRKCTHRLILEIFCTFIARCYVTGIELDVT